jgi:hypothetical protein
MNLLSGVTLVILCDEGLSWKVTNLWTEMYQITMSQQHSSAVYYLQNIWISIANYLVNEIHNRISELYSVVTEIVLEYSTKKKLIDGTNSHLRYLTSYIIVYMVWSCISWQWEKFQQNMDWF